MTTLQDEIANGPLAAELVPFVTCSDGDIAAILNRIDPAIVITIPQYTKEQFITGILGAIVALGSVTDAALKEKWDRLLSVTRSMDTIYYSVAAPLLAEMVTDGLITQQQIDAFTKRPGSRAEQIFGAGTVIHWEDVARAGGR